MTCFAVNVYQWGAEAQNRLLTDCLGPLFRALRAEGAARRFWFTRFDARGPHVCVVATARDGRGEELRACVEAALEEHLSRAPCASVPSMEEITVRHTACRGKQICALDGVPGLASNNSFAVTDHPEDAYPFGYRTDDELWELVSDLSLWAVDQLRRGTGAAAAVRWTADLNRFLSRVHPAPGEYWRYHATTLLPALAERLERDGASTRDALRSAMGERNREMLLHAHEEAASRPPVWAGTDRLVRLALRDHEGETARRWALLRELVHVALLQLGQHLRSHVPLIVCAWERDASVFPRAEAMA